jgi:hypothetical protein
VQSKDKASIPQITIDKGFEYVDERPLSANKGAVLSLSVKKRVFNGNYCLPVGETGLLIDWF